MSVIRIPTSTAPKAAVRARFQARVVGFWKHAGVGSDGMTLVSCDTQGIGAQPKAP